jgi:cell division protease FtsH
VFGDISTGASNDLKRITDIAKRMVREFGMSERIGNVNYSSDSDNQVMQMPGGRPDYSDETAEAIDMEVHALIEQLFKRTLAILRKNRDLLNEMSDYLKEHEVLDGDDLEEFMDRVAPLEGDEELEPHLTGSSEPTPLLGT